jgi:hypothetical protein
LNTLKKALLIFCVVGVAWITVVAVAVLSEVRLAFRDLHETTLSVRISAVSLLAQAQTTLLHAEDTVDDLDSAAKQQKAYWAKTSLETYKTMASLRLLIVRTDESVNTVMRPLAADALTHAGGLADAGIDTVRDVQPILSQLERASGAAVDRMNDPHISETLTHLDETSAALSKSAQRLSDTVGHVDETAALIETRTRQLTKPASLAVRFGKIVLGVAGSLGGIAAGFFR